MGSSTATVIGPNDGKAGMLGSIGARLMINGAASGGGFALDEHPMPPRALAAPLHRHTREDEYSYVLEGRMGALLGDEVLTRGRAIWCSSRARSGTRSGTQATSRHGSSRSSPRPASSSTSRS